MASIGKINIKGNILPKSGSIGTINIRFDGNFPQRTGGRGRTNIYRTDGNLQVIFRRPEDAENIEFEGKRVDLYYDY
jgi:hypothetical protein